MTTQNVELDEMYKAVNRFQDLVPLYLNHRVSWQEIFEESCAEQYPRAFGCTLA